MSEVQRIDEKDRNLIQVLQSSLYIGASEGAVMMVINYCRQAKLDPMQKPVHIVPMWDAKAGRNNDVIMPGIGLYRMQAHDDGCAGIGEPEFGPTIEKEFPDETVWNKWDQKNVTNKGFKVSYPEWCRVTVKKIINGEVCEFSAVERWDENYATAGKDREQPNNMWRRRPFAQLAKCAEAQALRRGFPKAIGSAPTAEEMEGKTFQDEKEVNPMTAPAPTRPAVHEYPDDKLNKNLPKWRKLVESGQKSVENIMNQVLSTYTLREDQKQKIKDLEPIEG